MVKICQIICERKKKQKQIQEGQWTQCKRHENTKPKKIIIKKQWLKSMHKKKKVVYTIAKKMMTANFSSETMQKKNPTRL